MLLPGLKVGVEGLMANYGWERARRVYAASLAAIDCVEQIVREESIQCHFGRCGHLEVAYKPAHLAISGARPNGWNAASAIASAW